MKSALNLRQTAAYVLKKRPVLQPVFDALLPLYEAQARIAESLAEMMPQSLALYPVFNARQASAGVPVLGGFPAEILIEPFRHSVKEIFPALAALPLFQASQPNLEKFFLESSAPILRAGLEGLPEPLPSEHGASEGLIHFAYESAVTPVLRALAAISGLAEKKPWDEEGAWMEGYCPFCGGFPYIAWLDKAAADEKNAFLAGGGGKKHFHCPQCRVSWIFRRSACPSCGAQGSGAIEILRESGTSGERLDYCSRCRAYHTTVDLREMPDFPDMDAMAPGLMHLDVIASQKKLKPLKSSCWNNF